MLFSLHEYLQTNSAYMLRNDGKLFKCPYHYYIISDKNQETITQLHLLFSMMTPNIKWFYDNINNNEAEEAIEILVGSYNRIFNQNIQIDGVPQKDYIDNEHDLEQHSIRLNDICNETFIKLRVGGLYGPKGKNNCLYVRVGSNKTNWFHTLWEVCVSSGLDYITITSDQQSGKKHYVYKHNNIIINQLPMSEFLMLPDNTLIENFNINFYENCNLIYTNNKNKLKTNNYLKENFIEINDKSINSLLNSIWRN